MYRKVLIFLLLLSALLMSGCSAKKDQIMGTWKRTDTSEYNGMKVKVEKLKDGTYRSIIIKTPSDNFSTGDVKWNNVTSVTESGYEIEDLGTDKWYKMNMEIISDDILKLQDFKDSGETGSKQTWERIE